MRIDAAIAYLERYLRHCDSSLHRQIARVSSVHREYRRLLENYRTMTSEDCGRILRFDAAADLGRRPSPPPSNTNLQHSATFDKLVDWMAG